MGSHAALVAKLESAKAGSRELDALIHIALHDPDIMTDAGGYRGERTVKYQKASTVFTEACPDWDGAALVMNAPYYTTNLQDIRDEVKRCGYQYAIQTFDEVEALNPGGAQASVNKEPSRHTPTGRYYQSAEAKTDCNALCAALLKALEAGATGG